MAQASQSEAQLLAAVASITPQSTLSSPVQIPMDNNITTISTSTAIMQQLTEPVTIIQQQQHVQFQIHPQPVSLSTTGPSYVVNSVAGSQGHPVVASVLGSVIDTNASGSNRRKSGGAAIISSSASNIQKNSIIFQASPGIGGASNRIILPNSISGNSTAKFVTGTSVSTTPCGTRPIRPNITVSQHQRLGSPVVLASTSHKAVSALSGNVSRAAGRSPGITTTVYSGRVGVSTAGTTTVNITDMQTLQNVQNLLSGAKFITTSGVSAGGIAGRGSRGGSVTVRGGLTFSRGGGSGGIISTGRGRGITLVNPRGLGAAGGCISSIRNITPTAKRQMITVSGSSGIKIGSGHTATATYGVRGTSLVLASVPASSPTVSVSSTAATAAFVSSPGTVDASTCTSPSLVSFGSISDGNVSAAAPVQQQQGQIILQLHQQKLQPGVVLQQQQQAQGQRQVVSLCEQSRPKQILYRPVTLQSYQQQKQALSMPKLTLHQEDLLVSQRNNAELLKVTPHHVIKTNTSVKTILPKENLDDSIIEINSVDGDTSGQSATTTDAEEVVVVPVAGHASKSTSATAIASNLTSEGTFEVARATTEATDKFRSKTTAAVTTDALVGYSVPAHSVSTAACIGTASFTTVNESLSRARAAVRYVTASNSPSVKCVSVTSVQTTLQGGGHAAGAADTEALQKGKVSSNQYSDQLETLDCILEESYSVKSMIQPSVAFAYSTHPSRITIEQDTVDKTVTKPLHGNEFNKENYFGELSHDVEIIEKIPRALTTSEDSSSKDRPHKVIITKPTLSLIKVLTTTPSLSETKVPTISEGSSHSQIVMSAKSAQIGKLVPTGKQSGSVLIGRSSAATFNVKAHTHKSPIHQVVSSKALTASSVFQNTNEGNKVQSSTTISSSFPSLQISDAHPVQGSSQLVQAGGNFSSVVTVSASSKSVFSSSTALKQETSSMLDATSPMRSITSVTSPSIMTVGASEAFAAMKATGPGTSSSQKAVVHLGPPVSVVSVSTASAAVAVAVSVSEAAFSLPASEGNVTDDSLRDIIEVESVSPINKFTRNTKPSAVHIISTSQAFAYKGKIASSVESSECNKVIPVKSQSKPNRILVSKASALKFQQSGVSAVRRGSLPNIVSGMRSMASDNQKHTRKLSGCSNLNNRELGSPEAQKTVQEAEATHEGDLILETSDKTNKAFDNNDKAAAVDGSSKAIAAVSSGTFYKPSQANLDLTEKFNQKLKEATLHVEKKSVSSKREPTKISVQDAINISTVKLTEGKKSGSDNGSRVSFVPNSNVLMAQSQHLSKTASMSPSPTTSKCVEVIVVSKKLAQVEIPDKNEQSVKTVDSISSISNEKANSSGFETKSCVASRSLDDTEVPLQPPQLLGKVTTEIKKTSEREIFLRKKDSVVDVLNPEEAESFSNLQKIDVDVIVQSKFDQDFIGVSEIPKSIEMDHEKDNSLVEPPISLDSTSTTKKLISSSPVASTRTSSAQPPGDTTDILKTPISISDILKKSLASEDGNNRDLSNTISSELSPNLCVLLERRRTTSESPTSSPKLLMPLRSRVNSQSKLPKDFSKVASVKGIGKKPEEDSNVEIKVEIDDSDSSFSMVDPKSLRSRAGVTSSSVEDAIKTRRKSATKSAVEQKKDKPVEAEAQISTAKNTATLSKVSKTVLVPGVSGTSTAGKTKQPLGLLMKHTGRGGHLSKGKTRASPRLSLTPYEEAAMLRSGKKRTSR